MWRYITVLFIAGILCGLAGSAWALTEQDVTVYKNTDGTELQVVVHNPTRDARQDFIRRIEVQVGSSEPIVQSFNFQRGPTQSMILPVTGLEKNPAIRVKATPSGGAAVEVMVTPKELLPYPVK